MGRVKIRTGSSSRQEMGPADLLEGDFVELVGLPADRVVPPLGSRFLVGSRQGNAGDSLPLDPATKGGARDRRCLGFSGNFAGCRFKVLRRTLASN